MSKKMRRANVISESTLRALLRPEKEMPVCGESIADMRAARASPFSLEEKACAERSRSVRMRCSIKRNARPLAEDRGLKTDQRAALHHLTASLPLLQGEAMKVRAPAHARVPGQGKRSESPHPFSLEEKACPERSRRAGMRCSIERIA
jgi:hypothetical protein